MNEDPVNGLPWFWENTSRGDAEKLVSNSPDGTFLLLKAANNQDYDVAIRVCGTTEWLTVLYSDGFFGFTEPLQFTAIEDILDAYNQSPAGNGKLVYPATKPSAGSPGDLPAQRDQGEDPREELGTNIREILLDLRQTAAEKSRLSDEVTKLDQQRCEKETVIERLRKKHEALTHLQGIIETHIKHHHATSLKVPSDCADVLSANYEALTARTAAIRGQKDAVDRETGQLITERNSFRRSLNESKSRMFQLDQRINLILSHLTGLGFQTKFIDGLLQEEIDPYLPHHNRSTWFVTSGKTPEGALKHQSDGTFLVRPSSGSSPHKYIIAVSFRDAVAKFPVLEVEGRVGFDRTTCVFNSLEELVLMYSHIPIGVHDRKYAALTLQTPYNTV